MPQLLEGDELKKALEGLNTDWKIEGAVLVREFTFPDFKDAFGFLARIAVRAEAANHHPDLELGWGRLKVSLTSHDAGGLTDKDFALAKEIDGLNA